MRDEMPQRSGDILYKPCWNCKTGSFCVLNGQTWWEETCQICKGAGKLLVGKKGVRKDD